jgi:hypothetical protein
MFQLRFEAGTSRTLVKLNRSVRKSNIARYYYGNEVKENKMGRVFSRNGEAGCGLVSPGSQVQAVGSCEYGNELSGSMQGREFLDQVSDCELLKTPCCSLVDPSRFGS